MASETEGRQILYPSIPSIEGNAQNLKLLSDSRVKEMMNKKIELEKELKHYKKVRLHWTRLDSTIKIVGTVATVITAVGASVTASIVGVPIVIPGILAGISAVNAGLSEIVIVGWTSKKKKIFRERCELIQSYMDKMYIYTEKCKQDGIITIEELKSFHKLIDEYNSAVKAMKLGKQYDAEKGIINKDFDRLEKKAAEEAKKEKSQEMKDFLKEKEKNQLRAKVIGQRP